MHRNKKLQLWTSRVFNLSFYLFAHCTVTELDNL